MAIALTNCNPLAKRPLTGTYHYVGQRVPYQQLDKFELTDHKFIANVFLSEVAFDYEVEDGYLYVSSEGAKVRFQIVSPDTLRAEANSPFAGTFVHVK
jgi:hypothetical protein